MMRRIASLVGIEVRAVRAHGVEADAPCLDPLLVMARGGDDRFVSSGLQTQGEGDVGMQVAQGAERREDDPPPGVTRAFVRFSERLIPHMPPLKYPNRYSTGEIR